MKSCAQACLHVFVFAVLLLPISVLQAADLRLGRYFSDNMVLQREKPTVVRGSADKGATVTVAFAGQQKTATADDNGNWSTTLDPLTAEAKPQELTATSNGKSVKLSNVVVGDVLLFARQTSIDVSLGTQANGKTLAENYKANPRLRAVRISTVPAASPQNDLVEAATKGWSTLDKDEALKMSAAAFLFGRDLAESANVPLGIIDLNMGAGYPINWLSREALDQTEKLFGKTDVPGQLTRFDEAVQLTAKGQPLVKKNDLTADFLEHPMFPAGGYNAVLCPLEGVGLKACLLQLGNDYPYVIYASLEKKGTQLDREELNRAYVQTYDIRKVGFRMESVTLPRVPRIWRQVFGDQNLPMGLIVPPGSALKTLGEHHREMRELQRQIAQDNPGTGVILPGSENVPFSDQPKDEAKLAQRCLAWVRSAVYANPDSPASGPMFNRMEADFSEATIYFKPGTAKGLVASAEGLNTFEAAGVEGDYSPAKATIDGETIRLKSETVSRITRVRYEWNSRPTQGLANAAGLPAMPFRTEKADYDWFLRNEDSDLPIEYSTPANQWKQNDVTLVNGQMKTFGYGNFSGWIGPVGIHAGPFGPNMGVREVKPGSPADGKLFDDDMIYSANGNMLGNKAWEVMAGAITDSETHEKQGKLVLGVHRDGKNLDVEITLAVMGTFSPTAPFDCPKTEKIISNLEKWTVNQWDDAGFLNFDGVFLLADGKPELQCYVRRAVYDKMASIDITKPIEPTKAGQSWYNAADANFLGEYFLATGDRNVLPHLKYFCDRLAATQHEFGGWRHNFPGGPNYGLIPNAGIPGVMGMYFATEAGVDINKKSYELGVNHFTRNRADTGCMIYGLYGCERPIPPVFTPKEMEEGKLESFNGGLSAAGILMRFTKNPRAAHLCSFISAFAWNNTFHGHGGNFWNNFWTPLGAADHGKAAYINFWKNYRWYRELNRMYDGSLIQHENGRVGAGTGVALVAPRKRIQIVGAPTSPFSVNAPVSLKPAVEAYWKKDYSGCEKLVAQLLASGTVAKNELATVEYLARAANEIQQSIDSDVARVNQLIQAGKVDAARMDLAQLKGIMPADDTRLASIEKAIPPGKPAPKKKSDKKLPTQASDLAAVAEAEAAAEAAAKQGPPRRWDCLITEITTARSKGGAGKVPEDKANRWRMQVVEDPSQAPQGWTAPSFDDSNWMQTALPISWRMYHTALLRTTFEVKDKDAFDMLRFRGWLFRQQGIEIYLNGELIAKVNNLEEKTGDVEAELKASAMKHLKNGTNTLAISTRHNWRWGMLSMHVYNDGFGFRLDARKK